MIKQTITYTDYEGHSRTEDFYFNLSMAELTKMELSQVGGYRNAIKRIIAAEDIPEIMRNFDMIIQASYGEKSPDGKRFVKIAPDGHRLADDFMATEAYSELYMKLFLDPDEAGKFVNGIVPKDVAKKAAELENDPKFAELKSQMLE